MREDDLVLAGQRVEFILCRFEVLACQLRNFSGDRCIEALRRVEARADGGAAERQFLQGLHGQKQQFLIPFQTRSPAGNFLREGDGRGVLQMRPAGLDNACIFFLQTAECCCQRVDGRDDLVLNRTDRRDVHRGRECVVGRLRHVDIIVRVQKLSARDLIAAVGNDLVAVHVGLRAGAGLPDDEREIVQKLAGNDLVRCLFNGGKLFFGHFLRTQGAVGARSSLFENAEGMDDLGGHRLDADADGEVVVAALGLCAPVFVCRDANLTHGIVFDAIFHCFFSFYYQIST